MSYSGLGRAFSAGVVLLVVSTAAGFAVPKASAQSQLRAEVSAEGVKPGKVLEEAKKPKEPKGPKVVSVPEIDAARGLAALAAVFAALALAWERRRHHG